MKAKPLLIGALTVALVVVVVTLWPNDETLGRAPEVELHLIGGGKTALTEVRAQKPVLITFWATDCTGCRKEVPHLVELYRRYNEKGFDVIAVAMSHDPPSRVWDFVRAKQIPYTIALDLDRKIAQAFGNVRLTPTTYVVSKDGLIVYQKVGEFDIDKMRTLIERLISAPA